ncbi:MAG: integrase core domain-containing protein, partial [Muribaculaceae bacterium]
AQAERINNTIKNELLKGCIFKNIKEVETALAKAISFYNNERPHMSINMMTPVEASNYMGEIRKRWKSYRLIAIKSRQKNIEISEKSLPLQPCQGIPSRLRPPVNP